jgi:hypothetical protein
MQQLNVDADKLANEYVQQNLDDEYGIVPILPTSGIQLNMNGNTVTHQLKRAVMQAWPRIKHQKYFWKRNNWTQEELTKIDSESHCQALNRLPTKRTILIKYLNDIAPVGKLVNKYDPKYPAICPSCPEE